MNANRHIERHQLPYYLNVFNAFTDKPIGHLGNVSADGLMLISQLPVLVGGCFDLRLKIPGCEGFRYIDFTATCLWCQEDVNPGSFDSGFALEVPPEEYLEMVEALRYYFSFHPVAASV